MRPATPRSLALLAILALAAPAGAQSHRIKFDRLSIAQGLSQGSGNVILQDSKGFVWIGTQDGLDRYDGYRFEVFKHDPAEPDSLADNFIVPQVCVLGTFPAPGSRPAELGTPGASPGSRSRV